MGIFYQKGELEMLKALKKRLKDQRGLTLVELLAVVVILGIIASIAVPSITGIINKAENDAKVAEAIQIINAAKLSHTSKKSITTWTHSGDATKNHGALESYLSNVTDVDYTVTFSSGVYTITDHNAAGVATNAGNNTSITEAELIAHTR
jgi:type IV pilus assembly protein PilA